MADRRGRTPTARGDNTRMTFRIAFVVVLFSVLLIACGDRYRGICQTQTTLITKNKALAATGSTIYGDPYVEARSC